MSSERFAAAINCMDGRTQIPVISYMRQKFHVDYVDMITELGPARVIAERSDASALQSIRRRLEISIEKHGSKVVAVVGHYDCAANAVEMETQLQQIARSIQTITSWGLEVKVMGLWIDEKWSPHHVDENSRD